MAECCFQHVFRLDRPIGSLNFQNLFSLHLLANPLKLFFVNLFCGFMLIIGCIIEQVNRYPNDWASVNSESFILVTMSGFIFGLGKFSIVAWEANFERSFFSQFCERVLIWIFPLIVLSGFSLYKMSSVYSLFLLGSGVIFFMDIGDFWRNFMRSKLNDDEIELTFSWLCIPVNPKSRLGVGIVFFVIYGLFSYFGWRLVVD
jgi:hypothetical protein